MTKSFNQLPFKELGNKILLFEGIVDNHRQYIEAFEDIAVWEDNEEIRDDFGPTRKDTSVTIKASDNPLWMNLVNILNDCTNTYSLKFYERPSKHYIEHIPENQVDTIHLSKYRVGGGVDDHTDEYTTIDNGKVSIIWYLDDDYEGGELGFRDPDIEIKPSAGDIFIFPCNQVHYAKDVTRGVKYISIRNSDI